MKHLNALYFNTFHGKILQFVIYYKGRIRNFLRKEKSRKNWDSGNKGEFRIHKMLFKVSKFFSFLDSFQAVSSFDGFYNSLK